MNKKIITAGVVLLFIGLVLSPSINANVGKSSEGISQENDTIPIELEYQRIMELVKTITLKKLVVNTDAVVDTLEDITTMIEENEDLRAYIEMKSDGDCGCNDANTTQWSFPVICYFLVIIFFFANIFNALFGGFHTLIFILKNIGTGLNCFWIF